VPGCYRLIGRIGAGGMAEVFEGLALGEAGFEKRVAIKRILPSLARDPALTGLLVEEARVASRLAHGNLVQVLDLGRAGGDYYLVMELVDGADLASLQRHLPGLGLELPPGLAVWICRQVLAGLHFVHQLGDADGQPLHLVHRDVSPGNILVSRAGQVKLTDFGIVKARDRAIHTEAGLIRGKAAYMPPEQAAGEPLDQRADLFSLGVVLHELLVGRALFAGDSPAAVLRRVVSLEREPAPAPSSLRPGLPATLDAVVGCALAPCPAGRYPSARAFDEALEAAALEAGLRGSAAELEDWLARAMPPARLEPLPAGAGCIELGPASAAPVGTLPLARAVAPISAPGRAGGRGAWLGLGVVLLAGAAAVGWRFLSPEEGAPVARPGAVAAPAAPPTSPDRGADLAAPGLRQGRGCLHACAGAQPAPVRPGAKPGRPAPGPVTPAGEGTLFLNSEPWARILVDGRDTGATTPTVEGLRLRAGRHSITLVNPELELRLDAEVELDRDEVLKRFFDLRRDGQQR